MSPRSSPRPEIPAWPAWRARVPSTLADPDAVLALAEREQIDFTVVGPELPLSLGLADLFAGAGRLLFGPTAAAARLESSKAFAKAFMARHGVPDRALSHLRVARRGAGAVRRGEFGLPVVLKADGLAAGKGVVIAEDRDAAERAIADAMRERKFGAAGDRLVIEECLSGPEVSFFALCDGARAVPIGTAQDHKRVFDDDRGPNTGGMGAFAPSPLMDAALEARVMREIVDPVIAGMAAEGCPFRGFLFVGLMLTDDGPKVIEFNARLGDPETQVILPLIDEPLLPLLVAGAAGALGASSGPDRLRSADRRRAGVARLSGVVRVGPGDRRHRRGGSDSRRRGLPRGNRAARRRRGHRGRARADGRRARRHLRRSDRARLRRRPAHSFRRHAVSARHRTEGVGWWPISTR